VASVVDSSPEIPTSSAARAYSFLGLKGFVKKSLAPSAGAGVLLFLAGGGGDDARHGAPPIVGAHRGQRPIRSNGHHQIGAQADVGFSLEDFERFDRHMRA
jgi:hypothetical protein